MDPEQDQESLPMESESVIEKPKRTRKRRRGNKNGIRITKKATSKAIQDLQKKYRAYVNRIRRKKSCRVKSFAQFEQDLTRKKRRKGKGKTTKKAEEAQMAPPLAVEEEAEEKPLDEPVPSSEEPTVESEVPVTEEEQSAEEPVTEEQTPAEEGEQKAEEEPKSVAASVSEAASNAASSVSNALGLTPEKKGGKQNDGKKKGSRRK